jgi:exodeoxyribonuclease VII large subunit
LQDILNVLRRRYPLATVVISPTLVQGSTAPPMIAEAVRRLDALGEVDVMIVARGGGSIEDLWSFNDEGVARAVFAANTPIVAGIGHETDFTIVDFVADQRAPTPSAAAELVTPNMADIRAAVRERTEALYIAAMNAITERRGNLQTARRELVYHSPEPTIRNARQQVDDINIRLHSLQRNRLQLLRERLYARQTALTAASPQAILERGYALITDQASGKIVRRASEAVPGAAIHIQLADGILNAMVEDDT